MQIFTIRRDASPTLFPYTTLFRSEHRLARRLDDLAGGGEHPRAPGARAARRAVLRVDLGPGQGVRRAGDRRQGDGDADPLRRQERQEGQDRKSTRLNSSHTVISYAVFCFRRPRYLLPFPTRRSSDLWLDDSMISQAAASIPGLQEHVLLAARSSGSISDQAKGFDEQATADKVTGTPTLYVGKSGKKGKIGRAHV